MKSGDEITLDALRREHVRVLRIAARAKAEFDEYMGIHTELFAINDEFRAIVESKEHGPQVIKRLDALKKRKAHVDAVLKKDLVKLSDRQFKTEWEAGKVAQEIGLIEFRLSLRKAN